METDTTCSAFGLRAWLSVGALALLPQRAQAATLRVGEGEAYAAPCAAVANAAPGDVIEIAAGVYRDSCTISVPRLTLRGSGKQPTIDLSGTDHPAQYKGIYVVTADDVTIENLELTGAHISAANGENAAGIRVEAKGLTVRRCRIHDNQNGILGGTSGTLTIEHTEFSGNGMGNGCNDSGCTHNVYVANIDTLHFRFNWSHAIADDTPDKGHLLKSRAKANYILYNRITGETGSESYEIELPNGGLAVVLGNLVHKGKAAGNPTLLSWGAEGASNADKRLFVVNNTFVNDLGKGTFIQASGATLVAKNNLFVGVGTPSSTGALSADNLSVSEGGFVDRNLYDYRLKVGSPAIDKAVPAGMADQFSLTAVSEYVQPVSETTRASVRDVGAYELPRAAEPGADAGGAASDSGVRTTDAGIDGPEDAAAGAANPRDGASDAAEDGEDEDEGEADASAGDGEPGARKSSGCALSSRASRANGAWLVMSLALLAVWRRRRRAGLLLGLLGTLACGSPSEHAVRDADSERDAAAEWDAEAEPDAEATRDGGSMAEAGAREAGASDAGASGDARSADAGPAASTDGGSTLCPGLGWCELTDTKLRAVCPDPAKYAAIQANEGCSGVINDWSGGSVDQKRNRLLVWGGGHRGYFGNELYALDLNQLKLLRLNDPSPITGVDLDQCTPPEAYADGRPSSRHTYDGLAYLPDSDEMFSLAGSGIPCGYAVQGTWTLDLGSVSAAAPGQAAPWTQHEPTPYPAKASFGVVADYDPNSERVIVDDTYSLWAFDPQSRAYTLLNDSNKTGAHIDYHMTGRVDPKRKLFVAVGGKGGDDGGMQVFDLSAGSSYAQQDWTSQVQGCDGLLAANSPGFAYDPDQDRLVGWAGGDTIYLFDPDGKRCTQVQHAGGPGAQVENGTFGRFRYIAALRVFAVINDVNKNAYALRLTQP